MDTFKGIAAIILILTIGWVVAVGCTMHRDTLAREAVLETGTVIFYDHQPAYYTEEQYKLPAYTAGYFNPVYGIKRVYHPAKTIVVMEDPAGKKVQFTF